MQSASGSGHHLMEIRAVASCAADHRGDRLRDFCCEETTILYSRTDSEAAAFLQLAGPVYHATCESLRVEQPKGLHLSPTDTASAGRNLDRPPPRADALTPAMRQYVDQKVRVSEDDLRVKRTFPLTDDRENWIRVPLGLFRADDPQLERDFFSDNLYLGHTDQINY